MDTNDDHVYLIGLRQSVFRIAQAMVNRGLDQDGKIAFQLEALFSLEANSPHESIRDAAERRYGWNVLCSRIVDSLPARPTTLAPVHKRRNDD